MTTITAIATWRKKHAWFVADRPHKLLYRICTLLYPISLIGLPLVDFVIDRYGYHGGLQLVNGFALGTNIVKVVTRNLDVQIVGFVFFSFFRLFLFSVTFSFIPTFLSVPVVGKATGIVFFVTAILSLINIPLAAWAVEILGSFFWPNLLWTLLILPCIGSAWYLGRFHEMESEFADSGKKN